MILGIRIPQRRTQARGQPVGPAFTIDGAFADGWVGVSSTAAAAAAADYGLEGDPIRAPGTESPLRRSGRMRMPLAGELCPTMGLGNIGR